MGLAVGKTFTFLAYEVGEGGGEFEDGNDQFEFVDDYVEPSPFFTFVATPFDVYLMGGQYITEIDLGVVN